MSVESPCIYQCQLITHDDIELCASCGRTRSEIVNWSELSDSKKREVCLISKVRLEKVGKIWVRGICIQGVVPHPQRSILN